MRRTAKAKAEMRNEPASAAIVTGAVSHCTRRPATLGPAICARERLISSFMLPSTSCSRDTTCVRKDWYATSKKAVSTPTQNPATYSCSMCRAPSSAMQGTLPRRSARPRSAATNNGRRRRRSTNAPAGRLNNRKGADWAAVKIPSSSGEARSTRIAVSGRARRVISAPSNEIV